MNSWIAGNPKFLMLWAIISVAVCIRLVGVFHDLPFSFFGDELHLAKRAMAIGSGDLNPHWFHKPAFLMYILTFCYGVFYLVGFVFGQFSSPQEFGAYFLQDQGAFLLIGRLVICSFGVATVFVVFKLTERISDSISAALVSASTAAVLLPMVLGSIVIKADVPAGFFVLLSVYYFTLTDQSRDLRPLIIASLLAGVAMGTKYFGIVLVPGFVLAQLIQKYKFDLSWFDVGVRSLMIGVLFVIGFFIVSPYNFLDPQWGGVLLKKISGMISLNTGRMGFDPDSKVIYEKGLGSAPGALAFLGSQFVRPGFLGWPLTIVACAGLIGLLRSKRYSYVAYLAMPIGFYFVIAALAAPYHVSPRHLNAIFPLICVLAGPGAMYIAKIIPLEKRWSSSVVVLITGIALLPTGLASIQSTLEKLKTDSRVEAHNWIVNNLPKDSTVLLDDYGPILQPNRSAAIRLLELLETFQAKDAFTFHQNKRLELVIEFPPEHGFDLYELGHQWWVPVEKTDEQLRASNRHRDMGNPLISRSPKRISEYREMGVRYVVTNSEAIQKYFGSNTARGSAFPSFVEFYSDLEKYDPVHTVDPSSWGGKGPVVYIYDILDVAKSDSLSS